ncbi:hypothetical protein KC336_g24 [Hortaea werneckii]|nr:hypothetical protein KC336_g24 [Hortaea werneckii]
MAIALPLLVTLYLAQYHVSAQRLSEHCVLRSGQSNGHSLAVTIPVGKHLPHMEPNGRQTNRQPMPGRK